MKKMNGIAGTVALAVMMLSTVCGAAEPAKEPLKVLAIGNSFSLSTLQETPKVAKSMNLNLLLCSVDKGGARLDYHLKAFNSKIRRPRWNLNGVRTSKETALAQFGTNRVSLAEVLQKEKWDIVTVQQASAHSWKAETYEPAGGELVAKIRELAPQAKVYVQETWSYAPGEKKYAKWGIDQKEMTAKALEAYAAFAARHKLGLIPMGTAVQAWRKELPVKYDASKDISCSGDVMAKDLLHLNPDGCYLQGLVWTATLFNVDVTKCPYKPKKLSDDRATLMKKVAQEAVRTRACAFNVKEEK